MRDVRDGQANRGNVSARVQDVRHMTQTEILVLAARRGLVSLRISLIAREAGVSETTVRAWARGKRVSASNHAALVRIVGAEPDRPAGNTRQALAT